MCKITKDFTERVCEQVALGVPYVVAAQLAGASKSDAEKWWDCGISDATSARQYRALRRAVEDAEAKHLANCIKNMQKLALKSWQAQAWILERLYPERFNQKMAMDIKGAQAGNIRIVMELEQRGD